MREKGAMVLADGIRRGCAVTKLYLTGNRPIRARWSEISNRSHSRRWTEKEKNVIWSQWHSRDPRTLFRRNKHGTDGLPRSCYNALNVRITQNWGRHNRLKLHHASELDNSSVDCFQYKIKAYFFTIASRTRLMADYPVHVQLGVTIGCVLSILSYLLKSNL
jgi:hypothetical protein